jgi:FHS family L-fucose permease-like MFS transporter
MVTILSNIWLASIKIEETKNTSQRATFASSFKLLRNGFIALMVLCIFMVVGVDVGVNAVSGQFLLGKFESAQTLAESARSLYFFGKMLGTFGGAILLTKLSSNKFFMWTSLLGLLSIVGLVFAPTEAIALVVIFIIGLGIANIFPLVFSLAVERYPERANEISGLMVMAISGGAVLPPLMGWIGDTVNITASLFVLVAAMAFIIVVSFSVKNSKV